MQQEPLSYLIRCLSKSFRKQAELKASELGINVTYTYILKTLSCNPNGLKQNEICNYAKCSAPTISLTLNNMENEGLIERNKSDEDNRVTIVKLSKKGYELNLKLIKIFEETEEKMISKLDEKEIENLKLKIKEMTKTLEGD